MVCVVISYHYLTSTTLKRRWEWAWGSATLNLVQPNKKPRCDAHKFGRYQGTVLRGLRWKCQIHASCVGRMGIQYIKIRSMLLLQSLYKTLK